jgi:hypothetical protein
MNAQLLLLLNMACIVITVEIIDIAVIEHVRILAIDPTIFIAIESIHIIINGTTITVYLCRCN